jgi:hypothetical protein
MGLLDIGKVDQRKEKDIRILGRFVEVFCHENHPAPKRRFEYKHLDSDRYLPQEVMLCDDCYDLLNHGLTKLLLCPYDPKPICKKCLTHCYRPGYREQIKKVMRFSGMHLIKHGRLDLLVHYFM